MVSQRLQFRPGLNLCVPECEVLMATLPIRNYIRNRDFFKIISTLETGAEFGMWTFQRYRSWLDKRPGFHLPARETESDEDEPLAPAKSLSRPPAASPPPVRSAAAPAPGPDSGAAGRIEIEPTETFEKILKKGS